VSKPKWQNEGDVFRHPDGIAYVRLERARNGMALIQRWWSAYWRDGTPMARKMQNGTLFAPRFADEQDAMKFAESREPRRLPQ